MDLKELLNLENPLFGTKDELMGDKFPEDFAALDKLLGQVLIVKLNFESVQSGLTSIRLFTFVERCQQYAIPPQ